MTEEARARHTDPSTSHEAAQRVRVEPLRLLILAELKKASRTTEQLAVILDRKHVSISPRMIELKRKGHVRDSGARHNGSIVWELVVP